MPLASSGGDNFTQSGCSYPLWHQTLVGAIVEKAGGANTGIEVRPLAQILVGSEDQGQTRLLCRTFRGFEAGRPTGTRGLAFAATCLRPCVAKGKDESPCPANEYGHAPTGIVDVCADGLSFVELKSWHTGVMSCVGLRIQHAPAVFTVYGGGGTRALNGTRHDRLR